MNYTTLELYQQKVFQMSEYEAKNILVKALYHLQCIHDSRNSFSLELLNSEELDIFVKGLSRHSEVEKMHREAGEFLNKYRV